MSDPGSGTAKTSSQNDKRSTTRHQILEAALACFAQNGYHKTTMDDIVAKSGLSKGSLYWHFNSKQDLFVSLIDRLISEFSDAAVHSWTEDMSAADKIRSWMTLVVDNNEQLAPFFKIILDFWAQSSEDRQLYQIFDRMLTIFQSQLNQLIQEGIANGEFRQVNVSQLSLSLLALTDSLILYRMVLGEEKIQIRGTMDTTLGVILTGLKR